MMTDNYRPDTLAVRAGQIRSAENEHSEPIFMTSSYVYASAAEAAATFSGERQGNIYSRFTNPTVRTFEERLAALENGERCVATGSGMAAILAICLGLLKQGDHIVCSRNIFGSTVLLFNNIIAKFNISVTYVGQSDYEGWEQAINAKTRFLFLETPSNPLAEITDIKRLADIAHVKDTLLVVDNCFCSPALQKPLDLGADLVVHSATKYLDGQGRCIGGAVVGSEEIVGNDIYGIIRTAGPSLSPFNAWVFLKGLETLSLRMKAHCANALTLAQWLNVQKGIKVVHYSGLETHPQHALAKSQMKYFGGIVSFEVEGGQEAAWKLIDHTKLMSITANLGDTRTTITHPATTTHGRLTTEQKQAAGIVEGLVRIAVGLEDVQDIIEDIRI
ncbi:O-acetylhomoserine sulfhydrylase / O-succinylhomoserine sulfhydrylase [hydrothermal vent metagenome]|uniref:O-acetylhomoserine sulfhydrylase / O-succinylhomoserine sulfhydrylase n=1 Tax=hydrothermal vent metagenome TaxID=652676 RepID=A0A3B0Y9H5_9ZZZZ